jgi:hypothetical protein
VKDGKYFGEMSQSKVDIILNGERPAKIEKIA